MTACAHTYTWFMTACAHTNTWYMMACAHTYTWFKMAFAHTYACAHARAWFMMACAHLMERHVVCVLIESWRQMWKPKHFWNLTPTLISRLPGMSVISWQNLWWMQQLWHSHVWAITNLFILFILIILLYWLNGFFGLPVTMVASSLAYLVANSYSPSCTGNPLPHWAQTLPNPSCWIRPSLFCGSIRLLMISVRTSAAAPFRVSEGLDSKVKSNGINLQRKKATCCHDSQWGELFGQAGLCGFRLSKNNSKRAKSSMKTFAACRETLIKHDAWWNATALRLGLLHRHHCSASTLFRILTAP